MKKILFILLFLILSAGAHAYPKSLGPLLPPDAVYQPELSKKETNLSNILLKKIQGKFFTDKKIVHIFISNTSYKDILKHFSEKGIVLNRLAKKKKIVELEGQHSEKTKSRIDQLKDPKYHESFGLHQKWFIHVYSYTILASQKLDHTVIVFTKSVEAKK